MTGAVVTPADAHCVPGAWYLQRQYSLRRTARRAGRPARRHPLANVNGSASTLCQDAEPRLLEVRTRSSGCRIDPYPFDHAWLRVLAEPRGMTRYPPLWMIDDQLARSFRLSGGRARLDLSVTAFNVLNTSTPLEQVNNYGTRSRRTRRPGRGRVCHAHLSRRFGRRSGRSRRPSAIGGRSRRRRQELPARRRAADVDPAQDNARRKIQEHPWIARRRQDVEQVARERRFQRRADAALAIGQPDVDLTRLARRRGFDAARFRRSR